MPRDTLDTQRSMKGRELLIGVTGGIAAYKVADLVSKCVQAGARVSVILTRSARKFIGRTTFEALTGRPVYGDMFRPREHFFGEHIVLADRAELYLIAPATADTLARLAHGHADDLLTLSALTFTGPVLIAPAMNCDMWAKPAVARNVAQLRADGLEIIEPDEGWLSCGKVGPGRMASVERLFDAVRRRLESLPPKSTG